MPRTWRERIEENIYRDAYGIAVKLRVGLVPAEKRFVDDAAGLAQARKWRDKMRVKLREQQPTTKRGTLAADAERYYKLTKHLASWRERRAEIRRWVERYGSWPRSKITKQQILETRIAWLSKGIAPKTVNNRVASLAHLYRLLDGDKAGTPCDEVTALEVPETPAQAVDPAIVRAVYAQLLEHERRGLLRDAKTRARFMIYAAAGVRPSEIMRAQPDDVDLVARTWRVRTGKGGYRPGGLYLGDDLLAAWTTFIEAKAWGTFRESSFVRVLRHCGWPEGVRPYRMRHSVGIALSEGGADLGDTGAWLGHSRTETTREHYVPILSGRMRAAGELLGQRIDWARAEKEAKSKRAEEEAKKGAKEVALAGALSGGTPGSPLKSGQ
jgi:integrase